MKARRAPKKTIKKMRVALPVGDGDSATLAHGALVYGMVGGKREERSSLIAAARELRCAPEPGPEVWAREIEETLNDLIPEDVPLLCFGSGDDDDVDLRNTSKGVTKHAVAIMAALDHLLDLDNAIKAAAQGFWCGGQSACRAACSGARCFTRTSTRGSRRRGER
jgi:hypothetical protein